MATLSALVVKSIAETHKGLLLSCVYDGSCLVVAPWYRIGRGKRAINAHACACA